MRWIVLIVVVALGTGCAATGPALRQDIDNQNARIMQLEQRLTALEAYIRQLYDVLAKNGSLAAPVDGGPAPAPAPTPTPAPTPAPAPR